MNWRSCGCFVPLVLAVAFMGQDAEPGFTDTKSSATRPVTPSVKRVTERPGNRMGSVPVLMYHVIGPDEKFMIRSVSNFRNDLLRLYKMGFRPVTLHEYVTNTMVLPRGASPVVITFDDSHPSQFRMLPDGSIDPSSGVGIWAEFAKEHSDFPVKGTFFILPNGPFGQKQFRDQKLAFLKEQGSEIGSHSMTHTALNKLDDEGVKKELAESYDYILELGFTARSFATPYGIAPKNRALLKQFVWQGKHYGYDNVVLAGSSPAPSPFSSHFDRLRIPRIQAYEGTLGVVYWLNRISNGAVQPYVQP